MQCSNESCSENGGAAWFSGLQYFECSVYFSSGTTAKNTETNMTFSIKSPFLDRAEYDGTGSGSNSPAENKALPEAAPAVEETPAEKTSTYNFYQPWEERRGPTSDAAKRVLSSMMSHSAGHRIMPTTATERAAAAKKPADSGTPSPFLK